MTFRMMVLGAVALIAAAALYRAGEVGLWRRWLAPEPPPKPVVFDNGTVRSWVPASAPVAGPTAAPGPVRKCRRGAEVVYTNGECPPGSREQALQGGTFTVVGSPQAAAAPRPAGAAGSAPRAATVRDLVDMSDVERIKERRIEEAMRR